MRVLIPTYPKDVHAIEVAMALSEPRAGAIRHTEYHKASVELLSEG